MQYLKRITKYIPSGIRDLIQKPDPTPKIGLEIVFSDAYVLYHWFIGERRTQVLSVYTDDDTWETLYETTDQIGFGIMKRMGVPHETAQDLFQQMEIRLNRSKEKR
jgi:hypothetical protein